MVLQKRLDYGSSGYQVPVMPHVPRSAKGKRSARKKADENQMCPIDLLAIVAETLLEREISATPFSSTGISCAKNGCVKQEQFYKEKPLKAKTFLDRRSCFNEISVGSDILFQSEEERSLTPNTGSILINSDASDKDASGKSIISGTWGGRGYSLGTIPEKRSIERHSPGSMESRGCKAEDGIKKPLHQRERQTSGDTIDRNHSDGMCRFDDPMDLDSKPPALASSDSSVEVPLCGGSIAHNTSFPKFRDAMERAADRDDDDDDENSSGCTHPPTITSKAFRPQRIGDRRIKKLMASKFWKVGPTTFKDEEISDTEMKPFSRSRKMCYTRQRTQRCSFKRRKLFEHHTVSASRGGMCDEGTSNSPVKGSIKVEPSDSHENLHEANRAFSSTGCQNSSYESGDFHVKFSIKSFKVPELFIEMPKTATVASLKRTVMEAVTAILGGGLRVGVVLQGKKVRDDNKTLLQAGISHGDELDNLGFTLEPSATQAPPPLTTPDDPHFLLPCDATEPLSRIPAVAPPSDQGAFSATLPLPLTTVVNCSESDHDSVHSPIGASSLAANSKALVPVPAMSVDALAVVPLRKSRRSELVQRRIRRPFSVSEVEALVQAVEKLGTGRWRDVKLRAFDNAKHRTYVDLKDKWKTLVHTARISPQQRRGEPVPQELLDRVLAAHAHWSQHQAKLQVKPPPSADPVCLLI